MTFATIAAVNNALPGQRFEWAKTPGTMATGIWYSAWTVAGPPGQGVAPSSGVAGNVPTSATVGAIPFVDPSGQLTHLARISAATGQGANGSPINCAIYDRLWHNSGISSTLTTAQTINSVALTRPDANGAGVEAWWETYVVMGAGTPTVTLTYTDQSGNTGNTGTSGALATTMAVGSTGPFTLAAGDTGVRSVQTWQSSATFTSGTIGLVLRRQVAMVQLAGSWKPTIIDALGLGLPRVYDGAALELIFVGNTSNQFTGPISLSLAQG